MSRNNTDETQFLSATRLSFQEAASIASEAIKQRNTALTRLEQAEQELNKYKAKADRLQKELTSSKKRHRTSLEVGDSNEYILHNTVCKLEAKLALVVEGKHGKSQAAASELRAQVCAQNQTIAQLYADNARLMELTHGLPTTDTITITSSRGLNTSPHLGVEPAELTLAATATQAETDPDRNSCLQKLFNILCCGCSRTRPSAKTSTPASKRYRALAANRENSTNVNNAEIVVLSATARNPS